MSSKCNHEEPPDGFRGGCKRCRARPVSAIFKTKGHGCQICGKSARGRFCYWCGKRRGLW